MSFSPDIDNYRYKHANIFAWYNYVPDGGLGDAYPNYATIINTPSPGELAPSPTTNWAQECMVFPTLEFSFSQYVAGGGTFGLLKSEVGIDYLELQLHAVMNNLPPASPASSDFLDWRYGFGFGFSSAVWGWEDGSVATTDRFLGRVDASTLGDTVGALNSIDLLNVNGHNSGAAADYISNDLNTTPYESFVVSRSLVAAGSTSDADVFTTERRSESMQQVLYSTEVSALNPVLDQVLWEGAFARPTVSPTEEQINRTQLPVVAIPEPTSEGYTGDLKVFSSKIYHYYDSAYDHVRMDLKERYKSESMVANHRNNYIDSMTEVFNTILGNSLHVPRGMSTKKQISPKAMQQNYTTFRDDAVMPETTTTSTISSMTTMGTGGGGGSY